MPVRLFDPVHEYMDKVGWRLITSKGFDEIDFILILIICWMYFSHL